MVAAHQMHTPIPHAILQRGQQFNGMFNATSAPTGHVTNNEHLVALTDFPQEATHDRIVMRRNILTETALLGELRATQMQVASEPIRHRNLPSTTLTLETF